MTGIVALADRRRALGMGVEVALILRWPDEIGGAEAFLVRGEGTPEPVEAPEPDAPAPPLPTLDREAEITAAASPPPGSARRAGDAREAARPTIAPAPGGPRTQREMRDLVRQALPARPL